MQPIANAPTDGTEITIRTEGGHELRAKFETGFVDGDGKECGCWVAVNEDEAPPCWTDAVCWESNADFVQSDPPVEWKH